MNYSDPTANSAIGSVNREWEHMICLAYHIRTDSQVTGQIHDPQTVFSGIYRRLLSDPIKDLEKEVHRIEKKKRKRKNGSG